jgi:hypothetical protein
MVRKRFQQHLSQVCSRFCPRCTLAGATYAAASRPSCSTHCSFRTHAHTHTLAHKLYKHDTMLWYWKLSLAGILLRGVICGRAVRTSLSGRAVLRTSLSGRAVRTSLSGRAVLLPSVGEQCYFPQWASSATSLSGRAVWTSLSGRAVLLPSVGEQRYFPQWASSASSSADILPS